MRILHHPCSNRMGQQQGQLALASMTRLWGWEVAQQQLATRCRQQGAALMMLLPPSSRAQQQPHECSGRQGNIQLLAADLQALHQARPQQEEAACQAAAAGARAGAATGCPKLG